MTKKEVFTFVDEKFAAIKKAQIAVQEKIIEDFHAERDSFKKRILAEARTKILAELKASGHYDNSKLNEDNINLYTYGLPLKEPAYIKKAKKEIDNIKIRNIREAQDFKDDLVLLGIKSPKVLSKLEALRERVRKLEE